MADSGLETTGMSRGALPSPEEANRIAAVTGRLVVASDGRYYSGAIDEEVLDLTHHRADPDSVLEAISKIADCTSDPSTWLSEVEPRRLEQLWAGSVDLAIDWLTELRQKLWESRLRP